MTKFAKYCIFTDYLQFLWQKSSKLVWKIGLKELLIGCTFLIN